MVMELMDTSLTSFVKNKQSNISMETKISILYDVSLGLSYLHTRNPAIIHRDLSSNNVMLTSHLVAKIGDLGVAKIIRADSRKTRSSTAKNDQISEYFHIIGNNWKVDVSELINFP